MIQKRSQYNQYIECTKLYDIEVENGHGANKAIKLTLTFSGYIQR